MLLPLVAALTLWLPADADDCRHWRLELDGLGNTLFLAGDRQLLVPATLSHLEQEFCHRHLDVVDRLHSLARRCLTGRVRQVSGLLTFGFRKTIRRKCSSLKEKNQLLSHFACFANATTKDLLDSVMASLVVEQEYIRDSTPDPRLQLRQSCCTFASYATVCSLEIACS